ncbi:DUF2961 domain-containing protein [Bacteroidota bacterium]
MKLTAILIITFLISSHSFGIDLYPGENYDNSDLDDLKTFGTMGKEQNILKKDVEAELFSYKGKGCLTHMWFGGSFKGVEYTRIRIYVDGEKDASIDMELFLGHGIGFGDNYAPWGTERMGNIGGNSGIYNTYKIPFGKSIRITAQLAPEAEEDKEFWWIFRGSENLPIEYSGVKLPDKARVKLYKLENHVAKPLEEFSMCDIEGKGMVYQVTMAAKGLRKSGHWKDLSYMEACVRAYMGNSKDPLFLSSGLEDYFLGTYYFNKGRYNNMLAGLTHFDKKENEFSAYRLHEDDPVFFQNGLRLTNRCGEMIGNKVFHDPPETIYTTYVWVYEW